MTQRIGGVSADFSANTASFDRNVKKAATNLRSNTAQMNKSLASLEGGFRTIRNIAGTFGVALGVGALVNFAKRSLDAAGGLGELAEQVGSTVRNLQAYEYGAVQAGAKTEEVTKSLARLTRSIGDAANGEKEMLDSFNALGIGVLDQNGKLKSTDQILRELADAYVNAGDKAKFIADAARLGGRSFQKLLPLLSGGARGLDEMAAAAQHAGAILSNEQVAAADAASDAVARLQSQLGTMAEAAIAKAAPAIAALAGELLDFFTRFMTVPELDMDKELGDIQFRLLELRFWTEEWTKVTKDQREEVDGLVARYRELQALAQTGFESQVATGLMPVSVGGGTNPRSKADAAKAEAAAAKIQDVIDKLEAERAAIGKSAVEMEVYNNLKRAGVEANSAAGQEIEESTRRLDAETEAWKRVTEAQDDAILKLVEDAAKISEETRTPMEEYQAALVRINELLAEGVISQDTYNRKVVQLQDELARTDPLLKALEDSSRDFGNSLTAAFEDAIIEGKSFGEVVRSLIQDLARLALRAATSKLISTGISALVGAFAGGAGAGAGSGGVDLGTGYGTGGLYAAGGRPPVGQWSIVGEQGPELFKPDVAGRIIPNDELGMAGGGPVFNVDMRGASVEAVQRLERFVNQINGSLESRAIGAVFEEQRRNGRRAVTR
jgi:hypothetical protein